MMKLCTIFKGTVYTILVSLGCMGTVVAQLAPLTKKKIIVPTAYRTTPFQNDRYLTVPEDFDIAVYTRIPKARFLATTPDGHLLVSVPSEGKVKFVRSVVSGNPIVSDFVTGLQSPHDLVFHAIGNTMYLYVSEKNKVARYTYATGDQTGQNRQVVVDGLPDRSLPELKGAYNHELKNIAIDSDHQLYISIASTCNACESDTKSDPVRGAIYVYTAEGKNGRLFAQGIRNAEGLDFLPGTNTLWAVVNNRDQIAYPYDDNTGNYGKVIPAFVDNNPPEEFIRVEDGSNFGWPFCNPDGRQSLDNMPFDRDYELNRNGDKADCSKMTRVNKGIQAHSAPLGFSFLQDTEFPEAYRRAAVVGLHGSWNRTKKAGYKVIYFPWNEKGQTPGAEQDLVRGFLNDDSTEAFARPVDVAVSPAGELYISDDQAGTIFRLFQSSVTSVQASNVWANSIAVYPQPASKTLQVRMNSQTPGEVLFTFQTVTGVPLLTSKKQVAQGESLTSLDISSLTAGVYLLQVQRGEEKGVQRVVVE